MNTLWPPLKSITPLKGPDPLPPKRGLDPSPVRYRVIPMASDSTHLVLDCEQWRLLCVCGEERDANVIAACLEGAHQPVPF